MIVKRGVHVYGLTVTIKKRGKEVKKVIDEVDKEVSDVYFINYHPTPDNKFKLIVYFNVEEPSIIYRIAKRISEYDFVEEVKTIEPKIPGLLIDTESFPLRMGAEQRAIVFGDIIYRGLLGESRKKFGGTAEAFLFYLGLFSGEEAAKSDLKLASRLDIHDPLTVFTVISIPLMKALGYCNMKVIELKPRETSVIRVYDSFECEIGKPSDKPFSHFLRGFIAGLFSGLFKGRYTIKETKCIAKGDPYCEFVVTRVSPVRAETPLP